MADEPQSGMLLGAMEISAEMLNQLWQDGYPMLSDSPGELIQLDRQTGPETRRIKQLRMGLPKLQYRNEGSVLSFVLEQRALSELEVVLHTESGASGASLIEVRKADVPADRILTMSLSFTPFNERHSIAYTSLPRREVLLMWSGSLEYSYTGDDTEKRLLSEYYNTQQHLVLYQMPLLPSNIWLHNVGLTPAASGAGFINYSMFSPSMGGLDVGDPPPSAFPATVDSASFTMGSLALAFPENLLNKPPLDRNWLSSLLVPPNTSSYDASQDKPAPGLGFNLGWIRANRSGAVADVDVAVNPVFISPIVSIVGVASQRRLLELSGSSNANVAFEGAHKGALETESGSYYYVPPASQTPMVVYEQRSKTRQAPAILDTLRERATADVIKVTVGSQSARSTFVTLHAKQTHVVQCVAESDVLRLELWYYDVDQGKDVRVPYNETEWSILAGNGSVSSLGVFIPALSAPSPFTVIAGRDLGSTRLLYWAATIIPMPMYTASQTAEFFNG